MLCFLAPMESQRTGTSQGVPIINQNLDNLLKSNEILKERSANAPMFDQVRFLG